MSTFFRRLSALSLGLGIGLNVILYMAASYLPARRSSRLDPMRALRRS